MPRHALPARSPPPYPPPLPPAASCPQVVSWWGPTWRTGSHDTQGVNTDEVVGTIIRELERDSSAGQDGMKLAFHLEPYEGAAAAAATLCARTARA